MLEYKGQIKTDLKLLSNDPGKWLFDRLKITAFDNSTYSDLDKWLYFYLNKVNDPITVWNFYDRSITMDPGMHRFVGTALRECIWLDCRIFSKNKLMSNDHLRTLTNVPTKHSNVAFPKNKKFTNNCLTQLSKPKNFYDFWNDNLPEFLIKHKIKKHKITYDVIDFYLNKNGEEPGQCFKITSKEDMLDVVKKIFGIYVEA